MNSLHEKEALLAGHPEPGDDGRIAFASEAPAGDGQSPALARPAWKVLVVDDDRSTLEMTRLVLAGYRFDDRGLDILTAESAADGATVLERDQDIALMILDVVMESDNAGLDLVRHVRERLGNEHLQIILRTGQPGLAPEHQVIRDYAINDYRDKTELTATKLFTSVTTALRTHMLLTRLREQGAELSLLHRAVEQSESPIFIADGQGRLEYVNPVFTRIMGFAARDVIGRPIAVLRPEGAQDTGFEALEAAVRSGVQWKGELLTRTAGDAVAWFMATLSPVADAGGQVHHFIGVTSNVDALKRQQAHLEELAFRDALTGLVSRPLFDDRLTQAASQQRRHGIPFALLYVDLDGLKQVNDGHGHAAGDEALRAFGQRLSARLRASDTAARVGGDEFAVLLAHAARDPEVEPIVDAILESAAEPVGFGEQTLHLSASVGVVLAPEDGTDPRALVELADAAMYRAKRAGGNCAQWAGRHAPRGRAGHGQPPRADTAR